MRRFATTATALFLTAALTGAAAQAVQAAPGDIADRLDAIKGLTVEERPSTLPGQRWFWLTYKQPVDHRKPGGQWFEQRVMLQHKTDDKPMVLYTSGYHTPTTMFTSEPTALLDANQISVEYRYFTPSRPAPTDWRKDTIWQAATDEHRIIGALKTIYQGKWISTGGSKGGMTAVYHKRFYPKDVDGSVVYVAPNDVVNKDDRAYDRFFKNVGSDPVCRAHLKNLAREMLKRRPAMLQRFAAATAENGWTFTNVGSPDKAFENSVMDYEWAFWQYSLQTDCPSLPALDASDDDLYGTLDAISGLSFYTDQGLEPYVPYYYQAGTELGWPSPQFTHLRPLLRYESSYQPRTYVPRSIPMTFNPLAMLDIDLWVKTRGSRLMFLYGENDPWGSEPFRLGPGTRDSASYTAPGMNHSGRLIARLPAAQQARAVADLRRWAAVPDGPSIRSLTEADDMLQRERPPL
ncbi:S28 family serine protease [Actinomadura flavalba]|uniref:S28 family serine protease n=1 Tax=Actinomadura flavalba TaxID=1120938 RepID=UPI000369CE63|nr:S28 family serine protease [Actinomadura flavalba]